MEGIDVFELFWKEFDLLNNKALSKVLVTTLIAKRLATKFIDWAKEVNKKL